MKKNDHRLHLFNLLEQQQHYARPKFIDVEQRYYFDLSVEEKLLLDTHKNIHVKLYFLAMHISPLTTICCV